MPVAVIVSLIALRAGGGSLKHVRYLSMLGKPAEERIQMPIRGIRPQQIADTWNAPRGADRKHAGQDIFAAKGTPVYSATDGYVIRIGENSLGGKTVSVIGAGGRVYYYAHFDRYADGIVEGDFVSPESILGYVGNTGNARGTPSHLHFGVYTMSGAINPLPLLQFSGASH